MRTNILTVILIIAYVVFVILVCKVGYEVGKYHGMKDTVETVDNYENNYKLYNSPRPSLMFGKGDNEDLVSDFNAMRDGKLK